MPHSIYTSSKRLKQFLYSQYFGNGFRVTLGVLLPSLLFFQTNNIEVGIALSLGALCVSIPDNPGPAYHRRNAMLITAVSIFVMALSIGLLVPYVWATALLIAVSCFVLSMLNVFGARAAAIGSSVLIVLILGIDSIQSWQQTVAYAVYILAGGLWYFILSISTQKLLPYRPAEQALGECVLEVAKFIRIKAEFYNEEKEIDKTYELLLDQQVVVSQHQETVRDILFRTRKLIRDTSPTGRKLLLTFIDLVDLYEKTNATHNRYLTLKTQFKGLAILSVFHQIIIQLAEELEHIGEGLHNHSEVTPIHNFKTKLTVLKTKMDELETLGYNVLALKKILINIKNIASRIHRMYEYDSNPIKLSDYRSKNLRQFAPHQLIDWNLFKANITPTSNHFRHAARVSIVCLLAFIFTQTVSEGPHSYWILLTIIVILKPGFSLTKQRNIERVSGTIAGGLMGLVVLYYFPTVTARFIFLGLFMLLTYSFIRIRYVLGVLFMTPYILIVFSFTTHYNEAVVAWERIIDTLIGAGAAFAASYFIFPTWESNQLKNAVVEMLRANTQYFTKILERSNINDKSQSDYRLARRDIYVKTAQLTTAFQHMLSEPKSKQKKADLLYRFSVLNYQLSSYMATLSYQLESNEHLSIEQLKQLRSIWYVIKESHEKITGINSTNELTIQIPLKENNLISNEFLTELHQTATDIKKNAAAFLFSDSNTL
jgi:uncharacterized membrane protein (TIGR01666 family)